MRNWILDQNKLDQILGIFVLFNINFQRCCMFCHEKGEKAKASGADWATHYQNVADWKNLTQLLSSSKIMYNNSHLLATIICIGITCANIT